MRSTLPSALIAAATCAGFLIGHPCAAQPTVRFAGTSASGVSVGHSTSAYPESESSFVDQSPTIQLSWFNGHGGTSGGLVGWAGFANGWAQLYLDGEITQLAPNHTEMNVRIHGEASFYQPYNHVGFARSVVSFDSPLTINIDPHPSGLSYHYTLQAIGEFTGAALTRISDGVVFPSGSLVPAGSYRLLQSGGVVVEATPENPDAPANSQIIATFNTVTCSPPGLPPMIVAPPQDIDVCVSSPTTLSVHASGGNLRYQWRRYGANLAESAAHSGVNTPNLTIAATDFNSVPYDCIVTNDCGTTCSTKAVVRGIRRAVTVWDDLFLLDFPTCGLDRIGASMTTIVETIGGPVRPVTFQWYRGNTALVDGPTGHGSTITGANTPHLSIFPLTMYDAGTLPHQQYRCVIANECGQGWPSRTGGINYCPIDVDCSYSVDSADFFAYMTAFFDELPTADINHDDAVNSQDFFTFLELFFSATCDF